MVRLVLVYRYTNNLGTRRSSFILQCYGVAEVVGWNTWSCGLEGACLLFVFDCGSGWVCQVDWKHQTSWNGIVGVTVLFIHANSITTFS